MWGAENPPPLLLPYALFKQPNQLAQQLEHALGHLVGLGQHGLGGLDQDVILDVAHHLGGHIGVADGGDRKSVV